jgi:long-chain acyl-CoA synthetase
MGNFATFAYPNIPFDCAMNALPFHPVDPLVILPDILRTARRRAPHDLALADLTSTPIPRLTFTELYDHVAAFGRALTALGLKSGAHIAVVAENRVQWAVAYLAAVCHNHVVVPIDARLKENEIVTIVHASDAEAAVFSESHRDLFLRLRRSRSELRVLVDMDLREARDGIEAMPLLVGQELARLDSAAEAFPDADPDAVAALVFTSGSMGTAKGVELTHRNITANLMAMLKMIHIRPTDRFLSILPMHHTYECTCGFLCPLHAGASVHFARSLRTVADDMLTVKPTVVLGVPLLYDKMYRRIVTAINESTASRAMVPVLAGVATLLEAVGLHDLRRKFFHQMHERFGGAIRIFIVGGAAPDPQVARAFRAWGFTFVQGYGLTETSPIVALNRLDAFRDDAAGLPLPGLDVRIDTPDAEGRGEICVRGDSVMRGYYRNADATAEVLRDGWFHTGDLGWIDDDGFLRIAGRKKNVIIARNGKNVYPEELEDLVNRLPFVLESVVYGRRNAAGDEEIAVLVVPNADAVYEHANKHKAEVTPAFIHDLIAKEVQGLNRSLPAHKQIRDVRIKDEEFEKTTTQKIKRYLVRETTT